MSDVIDTFPPTPTQEGMLATSLRDPHRGVELEQLIVRFGERIDATRLRDGFVGAQARYEVLRSAFRWEGQRTEQVVLREAPIPFEILEVGSDADALDAFLKGDRERGFDMSVPPLYRATLIRGEEDVLVFTFHHVILDGRSYRAVLESVLDHLDGRAPAVMHATPSFGDYCRALAAHDFGPSRAYFAKALEGATTTPLPLHESAAGDVGHERAVRRETVLLLPDISALVALAQARGPSVANAVQAAWAWVLARSAHVDDVVFGTTRAGRVRWFPQVDEVVGCLIDTLPLRITVDESASPMALLQSVHAQNVALREHEQVPLTEILTPARTSLSSLVVVERYDLQPTFRERSGADARRRFSLHEQSDFPLLLAAYQDETRMRLVLEHDESELDHAAAELLLARVGRAMEQLGSGTDKPLAELDLFVGDEEQKLRSWARGPAADLSFEFVDVCARISDLARTRPNEIAVTDGSGAELSYEGLYDRSRRIAAALASAGTRPGDIVLVLLPRSIRWVATMCAVWRADAVYLPLDPMWPDARLAQVHDEVVESGASPSLVVVVDASTRALAQRGLPSAFVVEVAEAWDHPRAIEADAPAAGREADSARLAYLLFTSGTTGRPKGSRISHRALSAHAQGAIAAFDLRPTDRVFQFTAPGFDVSIEEVVPTLIAGGRVVLRSELASSDFEVFLAETGRSGVSVLNLPSAFLHELLLHFDRAGVRLPASVRLVVVGGERASPETFARFAALHRDIRLVNAYGPTEVTITSVISDLAASGVPPDGRTELPIGRAFGACRAHVVAVPASAGGVLGESPGLSLEPSASPFVARLAAIEEPGELWLSGPQVAGGYLARPGADARAFVPDPFALQHDVDRTAYRTGDLVKMRANGELVFLRRMDRQIKLRGHRIEPSEIEGALARIAGVDRAFVVLAGAADSSSLVAFVTSRNGRVDPDALRVSLARSLPSAMVPSVIVALDSIPTSLTGKVDRDALRARGEAILREPSHAKRDGEPKNDVEAWLMPIFAEILQNDHIDLDRSFFELGGHSLLAIRLLARLHAERPDLPLTLAMLFASPSVRELARTILATRNQPVPTLVRLNLHRDDIENETPLFCVCGVQLYGALARAMQADRPVFGAFLPVETDAASDADTALDVASMASSYIELIRRQRPRGPYLIGGESFGGLLAYEMAQQLAEAGEEVRLVALFDSILPRAFTQATVLERAALHLRKLRQGPDFLVTVLRRRMDRLAARVRAKLVTFGAADVRIPDEEIRDEVFKNAGDAYDPVVRPYAGRVLIFRARGGLGYEGENIRWDLGWSGLVRADTPVHGVEGDHLGILREPGASQIARVLRAELGRR